MQFGADVDSIASDLQDRLIIDDTASGRGRPANLSGPTTSSAPSVADSQGGRRPRPQEAQFVMYEDDEQ